MGPALASRAPPSLWVRALQWVQPLQRAQAIAAGPTHCNGSNLCSGSKLFRGRPHKGLTRRVCSRIMLVCLFVQKTLSGPRLFLCCASFVTIAQQQRLLLIAESQASNVAETGPSAVQGFISKYMNAPMQRLVVIDDKPALRPAPQMHDSLLSQQSRKARLQRSCSPIAATHP